MATNFTFDPCIGSEKIFILLPVLNISRFLSGIGFTNAEDAPNTRAKVAFEKTGWHLYLKTSFSGI